MQHQWYFQQIMKKLSFFITLLITILTNLFAGRSTLRPIDPLDPYITVTYETNSYTTETGPVYTLRDSHLEPTIYRTAFDPEYTQKHALPLDIITYRDSPNNSVSGELLSALAQDLVHNLQKLGRKILTHTKDFKFLKDRDFDYRTNSGLIICKYKKYPFVLKLFIEQPETFVQPFNKGFEPACIFLMGGGNMRHLSGLSRIKNLENINKKLAQSAYWASHVDTPRKWFWIPENQRWLSITCYNMGSSRPFTLTIPSIYGIICDYVDGERMRLYDPAERQRCMELSIYLNYAVDPHIKNFLRERTSNKLLLIDTEHFPGMLGIKKNLNVRTYGRWYSRLATKCLCDTLGRTKSMRRKCQRGIPSEYIL